MTDYDYKIYRVKSITSGRLHGPRHSAITFFTTLSSASGYLNRMRKSWKNESFVIVEYGVKELGVNER